ncbi:hypothetical protein PAHAL_3G507100 [Panicum hallii]|uniref:Uncharacterized protein n=1 Tax=Panicum hallii TaxID=206008 RepID=A0A2S3HFY4_9POAL|nr:hypothetical protein PAHAL_3G507100 [Panicum hallii]
MAEDAGHGSGALGAWLGIYIRRNVPGLNVLFHNTSFTVQIARSFGSRLLIAIRSFTEYQLFWIGSLQMGPWLGLASFWRCRHRRIWPQPSPPPSSPVGIAGFFSTGAPIPASSACTSNVSAPLCSLSHDRASSAGRCPPPTCAGSPPANPPASPERRYQRGSRGPISRTARQYPAQELPAISPLCVRTRRHSPCPDQHRLGTADMVRTSACFSSQAAPQCVHIRMPSAPFSACIRA